MDNPLKPCYNINKNGEMMETYFPYGSAECAYLQHADEKLAGLIDRMGFIRRSVDDDLFSAVVHHIVAQQISTKAQQTVWNRIRLRLGKIDADSVLSAGTDLLQSCGISFRKASYITEFAHKVKNNMFDLEAVTKQDDETAIRSLVTLKGVGVWTAEMILLFGLKRPNIFSFDDLALKRGLCRLYGHTEIDRALFMRYQQRFSPYCSVASFYLWALSAQ